MPKRLDDLTPTERALLPIVRHFLTAFYVPKSQSWRIAYRTAQEVWGEARGLALGQATGELIATTVANTVRPVQFRDALDIEARKTLTRDEVTLLQIIDRMRSDDTPGARRQVERLFDGNIPHRFVEAALRLSVHLGSAQRPIPLARPDLKVV